MAGEAGESLKSRSLGHFNLKGERLQGAKRNRPFSFFSFFSPGSSVNPEGSGKSDRWRSPPLPAREATHQTPAHGDTLGAPPFSHSRAHKDTERHTRRHTRGRSHTWGQAPTVRTPAPHGGPQGRGFGAATPSRGVRRAAASPRAPRPRFPAADVQESSPRTDLQQHFDNHLPRGLTPPPRAGPGTPGGGGGGREATAATSKNRQLVATCGLQRGRKPRPLLTKPWQPPSKARGSGCPGTPARPSPESPRLGRPAGTHLW